MRVWMPLPDRDFDTTEVAVPWRVLKDAGHEVVFATERGGSAPACDPKLISGVIFGKLGAEREPIAFYRELEQAPEFRAPIAWGDIEPEAFDGLILAGGHAPGMRQYLGSAELQAKVARVLGARAARRRDLPRRARARPQRRARAEQPHDVPAEVMERSAYLLTAWRHGRYYRTYPAYVEDEVVAALRRPQAVRRRAARAQARHRDRRPARVRRRGRALRLGALAGRRLPVRAALRGAAQWRSSAAAGGRDSSASDVIASAPREASSSTSAASSADRA